MINPFEVKTRKEVRAMGLVSALAPSGRTGLLRDVSVFENKSLSPRVAMSAVDLWDEELVGRADIPKKVFRAQLDEIASPEIPAVIKIGSMASVDQIFEFSEWLEGVEDLSIVFDPSFISKKGHQRCSAKLLEALTEEIISRVSLLVLNFKEAEYFVKFTVFEPSTMRDAAKKIYDQFGVRVLITGGHLDKVLRDIYYEDGSIDEFGSDRNSKALYGTGSTYSALIAAHLLDQDVGDSLAAAREDLDIAIFNAFPLGEYWIPRFLDET